MITLLVQAGAEVDKPDKFGAPALHEACIWCNLSLGLARFLAVSISVSVVPVSISVSISVGLFVSLAMSVSPNSLFLHTMFLS